MPLAETERRSCSTQVPPMLLVSSSEQYANATHAVCVRLLANATHAVCKVVRNVTITKKLRVQYKYTKY